MKKVLKNFVLDDSAATTVEYGLLIAFIAIAVSSALSVLGTSLLEGWIKPIVNGLGGSSS